MRQLIPDWLARPAAVLSGLAALAGAAMVFWAAVTGDYWWAVWAGLAFGGAGLLWHLADQAAIGSPSH